MGFGLGCLGFRATGWGLRDAASGARSGQEVLVPAMEGGLAHPQEGSTLSGGIATARRDGEAMCTDGDRILCHNTCCLVWKERLILESVHKDLARQFQTPPVASTQPGRPRRRPTLREAAERDVEAVYLKNKRGQTPEDQPNVIEISWKVRKLLTYLKMKDASHEETSEPVRIEGGSAEDHKEKDDEHVDQEVSKGKASKKVKRTKEEEEEEENAVDAAKPKKEGKKRITPDNQGEDETHKEQKKKSRKVKEEERQQLQQEEEAEYKESSVSRKRKRIPAPEPIPELTATPAFARKVDRIMGFMDGFTDMGADEARLLMRGRLGGSRACRMNVYWGRGAVGLHYRKGKDPELQLALLQELAKQLLSLERQERQRWRQGAAQGGDMW
eukprot:g11940.t1